jgi:hypothetical protein
LASSTICLIEDIAPNTPDAENMVAINVLIPNIRPSLEDLKVTLYNTIDKMMSRGMHPNAPITASMSPKKGNIAARVVAMVMDNDQKTNLGRTFTNRKFSTFCAPAHHLWVVS